MAMRKTSGNGSKRGGSHGGQGKAAREEELKKKARGKLLDEYGEEIELGEEEFKERE